MSFSLPLMPGIYSFCCLQLQASVHKRCWINSWNRTTDVSMLLVTKHIIFPLIGQFILRLTLHGFLVSKQSFGSRLTQRWWNTTTHSVPRLCESVEHAVNITQCNYPWLHAEVNTELSVQNSVCVFGGGQREWDLGGLRTVSHLKGKKQGLATN